jgi:serine protease Do
MEEKWMKRRDGLQRSCFLLSMIVFIVMAAGRCEAAEQSSRPVNPSSVAVRDLGNAFVGVAKKVSPSVVSIRSERMVTAQPSPFGEDFFKGTPFEDFFREFFKRRGEPPMKRRQMGEGSGVIVDPKGYILTNNHVVAGADKINVRLYDGREFEGTVRGTDPKTDLAVVHVDTKGLPVAALGDSDKIQVGEWAIAVGSPFGLERTVTVGVISAKGRAGLGTGTYEDFIQTDASINPGNSGGPLVNINGEVIGINAMIIWPGQGIGFAIPINLAKKIMTELIETGKVTRPWLGIGLQDLTAELKKSFKLKEEQTGALVGQVYPESPAEKAGLKPGDIIVEVDGVKTKEGQDVVREVLKKKVGQKIQLTIIREEKRMEVPVTTAQMPSEPEERLPARPRMKEWFGLKVSSVTPEIANQLGLARAEGVVIEGVEPGSAAQMAGLGRGDVILEVNREKIKDENDYRKALEKATLKEGVLFLVNRQGSTFYVVLRAEE